MDKVRETMEDAKEISDAISQTLGTEVYDEGALEDELAELENEINQQNKVDLEIPKTKITSNKKEEEITETKKVPISLGGGKKNEDLDDELAAMERELHGK